MNKLSDLLCANGSNWDRELIVQSFSPDDASLILKTPLLRRGQKDLLIWKPLKLGVFSAKSAYSLILAANQAPQTDPESSKSNLIESKVWKTTWSLKIKNKIKTFLWRCWFNFIGTQDQLILKRIPLDPISKICGAAEEFLEHIFFLCPRAVNVWKFAGAEWTSFQDTSLNFRMWWTEICTMKRANNFNDRIHFSPFIQWRLWKCRNLWVFNNIWKFDMEIATQARSEWVEFEESGLQSD
ncbi:Ribonuclease H-like superfamily protein [Striga hermonthica]|uniref:Ribonuclease H-like superfamily protein n=1 Tax=Striga hermonthica TaxID=68872 RepID=A0A9N7MN30_STRHE|nr:Ribonuclease H-like superfamily protein [Striga hermonthica]